MWALLSTRVGTWLAITVVVPLARVLLHQVARVVDRRNPHGRTAKMLSRADNKLAQVRHRRRASKQVASPNGAREN